MWLRFDLGASVEGEPALRLLLAGAGDVAGKVWDESLAEPLRSGTGVFVFLSDSESELSEELESLSEDDVAAFFAFFFAFAFLAGFASESESESLSDELESLESLESEELEADEDETEAAFFALFFLLGFFSASDSELLSLDESLSESLDDESLDASEESEPGRGTFAASSSELLSESLESLESLASLDEDAEDEETDLAFFAFVLTGARALSDSESEESELESEELAELESSFFTGAFFAAAFLAFLGFVSASDSLLESLESLESLLGVFSASTSKGSGAPPFFCHCSNPSSLAAAPFSPCCSRNFFTSSSGAWAVLVAAAAAAAFFCFLSPLGFLGALLSAAMVRNWGPCLAKQRGRWMDGVRESRRAAGVGARKKVTAGGMRVGQR